MWSEAGFVALLTVWSSLLFVGGCFCGSWVQRSIGYVIKSRTEKELLDAATDRAGRDYDDTRLADYQENRSKQAAEAAKNVTYSVPENPLGQGFPSPDDLDRAMGSNPNDWTKDLSTERLREAQRRG